MPASMIPIGPMPPGPFKALILSTRTDCPYPFRPLRAFLYSYKALLCKTFRCLSVDGCNCEELAAELPGKLGSFYGEWKHLIVVVEFTLDFFANKSYIEHEIPAEQILADLQMDQGTTFEQTLLNTIKAKRLWPPCKMEHRPTDKLQPRTYMAALKDAVRRLYGILYSVVPTMVVWTLSEGDLKDLDIQEARSNIHYQTNVSKTDILPQGRYRAICKLIMRNGSVAYEGTGFLVDDLTLVTAASNVLRIDGPVTSINVYAGYWGSCHVRGEERIGQVQCAERIGKRVAVHWGYYDNRYAVQFDLAVIRVNEPFTLVHNYIEYSTCPNDNESEDSCIRVVGYPEHLPEDAKGKYMYESQGHSEPDIVDDGYLLKYSLYGGGSSGSPVLKFGSNGKFHAIGVHRDGDPRCSEAAPLGHNGNLIPAFVRGIEIMESADRQNDPCYRIEEIFSKTPEGLTKISILRPPDEQ